MGAFVHGGRAGWAAPALGHPEDKEIDVLEDRGAGVVCVAVLLQAREAPAQRLLAEGLQTRQPPQADLRGVLAQEVGEALAHDGVSREREPLASEGARETTPRGGTGELDAQGVSALQMVARCCRVAREGQDTSSRPLGREETKEWQPRWHAHASRACNC